MRSPRHSRLLVAGATFALAAGLAVPLTNHAAAEPVNPTLAGPGLSAVVPQVKTFKAAEGLNFALKPSTRIILTGETTALTDEAALLASELVSLDIDKGLGMNAVPKVVTGAEPGVGDIVLGAGTVADTTSTEAYSLKVDGHVTITGASDAGVFYGTRTLLQSLSAAKGAEAGTVTDEPDATIRSLHVDAARKYFSPGWFEDQIRQMAYVKLNQLQYHFSENEGFRLESSSHPNIVSSQYLTKAELAKIIKLARTYHIEVVPALDVPGHMAQALKAYPELRASSTSEGSKIIDYSKPEGRKLVTDLIDEYADLFPSTAWHLGGDEVFALEGSVEARFPQLLQYAKDTVGPNAKLMDGYVHYLNTVAEYLNGKGKSHVRAWNDALYTPGTTQRLNSNVDIAYWTRWHASFPTVDLLKQKGHKLINFNDSFFYYVLTYPGWAYSTKPTAAKIYQDWKPGVFPWADRTTRQDLALDDPALLGASFAIWCDKPAVETEAQVAGGIKMPLRAMASRSWNANAAASLQTWQQNASTVGDAPAARELAAPSLSTTLAAEPSGTVKPGTTQTWTSTTRNDGATAARATIAVDVAKLAAVASLGQVSTAMLDASGKPVAEPGVNAALNRPTTASGQEVAGMWGPALAVDGDEKTRFSSNESDNAWIAVELAQPTTVDHVTIKWELGAKRYKVQVSDDGTSWMDATAERSTASGSEVSRFPLTVTTPVKFVRMQALERTPAPNGNKYGVSMHEFEVWTGPEQGASVTPAVVDGGTIRWTGDVPAGHSVRLTMPSTINKDAAAGASFTVTSTVDAPYFPRVATASVSGKVAGEPQSPSVSPSASITPSESASPSVTPSGSASASPSQSGTPSATPTQSSTAGPSPAPTITHSPGVALTLSKVVASVGDRLTVSAAGFAPGETLRVEVHSDPIVVARATANAQGVADVTITVPKVDAGAHRVVVVGETSGKVASAALQVKAGLPNTGASTTTLLLVVAGLLAAAGGVLLLRRRQA